MRRITARCALAVLVAATAAAQHTTAAEATTVGVEFDATWEPTVKITGALGEVNRVSVSRDDVNDLFIVTENGTRTDGTPTPITPGHGCQRNGALSVACPTEKISAYLGDMNDSFAPARTGSSLIWAGLWRISVDGGAGDDSLYGGDIHDTLKGGSGNDKLYRARWRR